MGIARYIKPWTLKRDKQRQRLAELRQRDGDNCRRCRRPIRFDLAPGNDQAPMLEQMGPKSKESGRALDAFCLCHVRCSGATVDNTAQVQERLRLRTEASAAEEAATPKRRAGGRR